MTAKFELSIYGIMIDNHKQLGEGKMNDQYLEEGIKCKDTSKNKGIRLGLIVLVLFTFFLVLINPALIISPVVAIALAVFIFSRLKIEYEYIYADGQIDFDRISGNAKRKTLMRVDIENAEVISPTSSDSIKAYNNNNRIKVKDFSSYDNSVSTYSMIVSKNGELYKIIFEPSERMVKSMKYKQPRKVKEY